MNGLSIDDIKAIELNIMAVIECVYTVHGLQHFFGYGSLFGVVRHGGFISQDVISAFLRCVQTGQLSRRVVDFTSSPRWLMRQQSCMSASWVKRRLGYGLASFPSGTSIRISDHC